MHSIYSLRVCACVSAAGIWELLAGPDGPHDGDGWSAAAAAPGGSGDVVHLATAGGALALLDTRAGGFAGRALTIATRKVNTLAAHAGGTLLLSAATSGAVAVWDVRKLAFGAQGPRPGAARAPKPLCEIGHDKSSQVCGRVQLMLTRPSGTEHGRPRRELCMHAQAGFKQLAAGCAAVPNLMCARACAGCGLGPRRQQPARKHQL